MNNIILDVTNKKGITAVVVCYCGKVVEKSVYRSKYENQYDNLLDGYILGAKLAQAFILNKKGFNGDLLVVSSNSALITWLKRNYANGGYTEKFNMLSSILETIPVHMEFIRSDNLVSSSFATRNNIVAAEMTNIDSFFN